MHVYVHVYMSRHIYMCVCVLMHMHVCVYVNPSTYVTGLTMADTAFYRSVGAAEAEEVLGTSRHTRCPA